MEILLKEYNSAPAHSKPKVKHLAEKYGIPTLTVWKHVNDIVKGQGITVAGQGNQKCCLEVSKYSVKQKRSKVNQKMTKQNVHVQTKKILFFRG